jgi:hypothetical protein
MKALDAIKNTDWITALLILALVAMAMPFVAGIIVSLR